ncbi:hypothetical protein [Actinoplanes couchii]|uniref:hypothetical protein n=1 Tax=Actinoplanes couchii TaxID=403638 RepID=UPI0019437270|nr:hypothetical protein [Actinoplanes couchii]MDR6324170.1 hypothetical protein [Actinoplanes couchii]
MLDHVDVFDAESGDLAAPESGPGGDQECRPVSRVDRFHQFDDLGRHGDRTFRSVRNTGTGNLAGITSDQTFSYRDDRSG